MVSTIPSSERPRQLRKGRGFELLTWRRWYWWCWYCVVVLVALAALAVDIGGGHWRWTLAVDIGNTYLTLSYALAICNGSEGIRNWGENRPKEALHGVVGAFANTLPSGTWVDANHAMQCS